MNTKETSRLMTTFLCISFLFVFFQSTSSQHLSTNLLKARINNNDDDGNVAEPIRIRPLSYSDSDDSEELLRSLSKLLVHNKGDQYHRPSSSSPIRRANFWKRANFWRKRANFWRRDLPA